MADGGKKKRFGLSLKSSKKTVSAKSQNQPLGKYFTKSQEKKCAKNEQVLDVSVSNAEELSLASLGETSRLVASKDIPGLFLIPNELRNKFQELMPVFSDWKNMKPIPNSPVIESLMVPKTDASPNSNNQTTKHETENSLVSKTNAWKDIPRCKFDNLDAIRPDIVLFENSKDGNFESNSLAPLGPLEFHLKSIKSETQEVQNKGEDTKLKQSNQLVGMEGTCTSQTGERGILENENKVSSSLLDNKKSELLSGIDISDFRQNIPEGTPMDTKGQERCVSSKSSPGSGESSGLSGHISNKKQKVLQSPNYVSIDNNDYQDTWDDVDDEISKYDFDKFTDTITNKSELDAKNELSREKGQKIGRSTCMLESKSHGKHHGKCFNKKRYDSNAGLADKTQTTEQKWRLIKGKEIKPVSSTSFRETSLLQSQDYADVPEIHLTGNKMGHVNKVHEKLVGKHSVNLDRGETSAGFGRTRYMSREELVGVNTKRERKGLCTSPIIICDDEQENIDGSTLQDDRDAMGRERLLQDHNDNLDDLLTSFGSDLDDQDLLSCYDDAMSPTIPVRENKSKNVVVQNYDLIPERAKRRLDMPEKWQAKIRRSNESTIVSIPSQSRGTSQNKSKPDRLKKECPICLEHFEPGFSSHDINEHITKCEQIVNDDEDLSLW